MTTYLVHGVVIAAPFPLARQEVGDAPELELSLGSPRTVGADMLPGEPIVDFSMGGAPIYSAVADVDGFRLRIHGLCDFVIESSRRRAVCHPDPSADMGAVALVSRGAFLAFWLGLGGACTLHASAVEVDGSALVFVGGSGMGKSTMAAWICTAGGAFISDDLLRLSDAEQPGWVGHSPELRLRSGAEDLVADKTAEWTVRPSADGRLSATPPVAQRTGGKIATVIIPAPDRQANEVRVERLDPVQATLWVSRFPRLEGWRLPVALEAQLEGASRLARHVPVVVAVVPWGPPFPPRTAHSLLELVQPSTPTATTLS